MQYIRHLKRWHNYIIVLVFCKIYEHDIISKVLLQSIHHVVQSYVAAISCYHSAFLNFGYISSHSPFTVYYRVSAIIVQCFTAFSIYTNIAGIFATEGAHKPGQIGPIHFMRLASFAWIVTGHVAGTTTFLMSKRLLRTPY